VSRDEFTMKFDDAEVKRILDKLGALAADVQKKHAERSARLAMKPVVNSARQKWKQADDPATPSNIPKNITMRKMGKKKLRQVGGDVGMSVGVRGGAKENKTYPFHWRFLEFGTSKIGARGYMRQAAAENMQAVQRIFTEELGKDVHQQARRR
jgi:HK97 gp10 family phage protein